jgi:cell division protein FtsB
MKKEFKKITLVLSLVVLVGLSGCLNMKDSGQKSQSTNDSVTDSAEELDSLRASNKQLSKENEELKTENAKMQSQLRNLEKRDVKLSQQISELNADLRQRILIADGLLLDKKELLKKNKELQAGLDALKNQKSPTAGAEK